MSFCLNTTMHRFLSSLFILSLLIIRTTTLSTASTRSNLDAFQQKSDMTKLTTNSTTNNTNVDAPTPYISFLHVINLGIRSAQVIDFHVRPLLIIGTWRNDPQCSDHPVLVMAFNSSTRVFGMRSPCRAYGTWIGPFETTFSDFRTPNFDFGDLVRMDLPEAWILARSAGWPHGLHVFGVEQKTVNGESEVWYQFRQEETRMSFPRVYVGTRSKRVFIQNVPFNGEGYNGSSDVVNNLVNGVSKGLNPVDTS